MNLKSTLQEASTAPSLDDPEPTAPVEERLHFDVCYKKDAAIASDAPSGLLARNLAISLHAERLASFLHKKFLHIVVTAGNPVYLGDGVVITFTAVLREDKAPKVATATTRLEEAIRGELQTLDIATQMLRAGHIALDKCLREGLPTLPQISLAKANQKEIVTIGMDASLYVTVADGVDCVKRCKALMKAAESVNACGMRISARARKDVFEFVPLPTGACKTDWISIGFQTQIGKVTGFHDYARVAEILIEKTIYQLAVKYDEADLYANAYRMGKFVKLRLKTARPGNPFQFEDPKISIEETLEVLDENVQKEWLFGKPESDPKIA